MGQLDMQSDGSDESRLQSALIVLTLVALPIAAGLYLLLPPSLDQWQLDYTGWLITRGEAPYVDIRDGNWPASHWLHAISLALSGPTFGGWRRFDLLLLVPTVIAGAALSRRIWGRSAGYWFTLLYPCLYVSSGYWFAGQRDILASHFGLMAAAAYWEAIYGRNYGRGLTILSGVCLTVATLIKPTFAIIAVALAIHAAVLALRRDVTTAQAIHSILRIAGWSVAALIAAILILWVQGSTVDSFFEHAIRAILLRVPNDARTASESFTFATKIALDSWHWILVGGAIATLAAIRSKDAKAQSGVLFCWLFVAGGLVSHVVQGHSFVYYLAPIFLGLVLLSCGALGLASSSFSTPGWRRTVAVLVMLIALVGTAKKMVGAYGALVPVALGDRTMGDWEDRFWAGNGLSAREARVLADEMRPLLPEHATLFVWGRANVLNLLVERPQPTGFYHRPHIERDYLPDELSDRWTAELLGDLLESPPAVALVDPVSNRADTPLQRGLRDLIASRYRFVHLVGTSALYVLDDPAKSRDSHARNESLEEPVLRGRAAP